MSFSTAYMNSLEEVIVKNFPFLARKDDQLTRNIPVSTRAVIITHIINLAFCDNSSIYDNEN